MLSMLQLCFSRRFMAAYEPAGLSGRHRRRLEIYNEHTGAPPPIRVKTIGQSESDHSAVFCRTCTGAEPARSRQGRTICRELRRFLVPTDKTHHLSVRFECARLVHTDSVSRHTRCGCLLVTVAHAPACHAKTEARR